MTSHDPYRVEPRKPLSTKQRMEMFVSHGGKCCICGEKIKPGETWADEHLDPLWRDGTNAKENRAPAHTRCAKVKTAREATERAKGRRIAEKHFGAHQSKGAALPGTKRSGWKRKMDGTVERRK